MYQTLKDHLSFIVLQARRDGVAHCVSVYRQYPRTRRHLERLLRPLVDKHYTGNPENTSDVSKYLNLRVWTLENLARAIRLNLHRKRGLRVLDIGTGCGYFPHLCSRFGHDAAGVDLDAEPLYNQVIALLGVKRHIRRVQKFEPLDIEGPFDLVTAFMICFNDHKQPGLWHIEEWEHFLNDMEARLNSGGRIYLSFNAETPTEPVSVELLRYFESRGGHVEGSDVLLFKR
jgi:SAM-dependent methyltransferase